VNRKVPLSKYLQAVTGCKSSVSEDLKKAIPYLRSSAKTLILGDFDSR
ncbi:uncharacterized protein METZ01_LOCUS472077, partial [marine metagenome]